ncbi:MAG: FecR domain-containing protein [Elusimicrobia bacterium]|nr:FecR domain-containing protein [Elusimicrobiota bacterium]
MTSIAALLLAAAAASHAAPVRIGAAGGVSGGVTATTEAKPRALRSGDTVFHKDAVATDAKGRMQAMLLDETVFTVGPNSKVVLDEFVYDPFTDAGKVRAEVLKGVFRLVTGKTARRNPDIKVKTPSGTIGIRGTIAGGSVDGDRTLVALLGPGPGNNADERPGAVTVTNGEGSVDLDRPGTGTVILPGEPPSPPFTLTPADLASLDAGGSASGSGGGETAAAGSMDESAADESGESTALGGENAISASDVAASGGPGTESAIQAIQTTGGIRDGVATWDNLRTIPSGQAHYFINSAPWNLSTCANSTCANNNAGSMQLQMNIDFGAATVGGLGSAISVNDTDTIGGVSVNETINIPTTYWGTGDAPARISITESSAGITNSTVIDIQNFNGNAAHQAQASFTHTNTNAGSENQGSGSTTAPRFDGLIPQ